MKTYVIVILSLIILSTVLTMGEYVNNKKGTEAGLALILVACEILAIVFVCKL
jgi:hypothetical protein